MSEKIILEEVYETGDLSNYKNDYKIRIKTEKGEEEQHIISYTSQEVIDILEDGKVEIVTTIDAVKSLKGDEKKAKSSIGQKDKHFISPNNPETGFPREELERGQSWKKELPMLLSPHINWPSGNTINMPVEYTLEGIEDIDGWRCAKIKLDSNLTINVPSEKEAITQERKAAGYTYFGLEDGKLIKSTSHITNVIKTNDAITLETEENLTIELIDFDWN